MVTVVSATGGVVTTSGVGVVVTGGVVVSPPEVDPDPESPEPVLPELFVWSVEEGEEEEAFPVALLLSLVEEESVAVDDGVVAAVLVELELLFATWLVSVSPKLTTVKASSLELLVAAVVVAAGVDASPDPPKNGKRRSPPFFLFEQANKSKGIVIKIIHFFIFV
ncbi:hypothetical protein LPTSP3_g38210 [Leptospira kobayashii]|uniref:Secreted protein n=1 Tax=Leptospira kobayashii TaxID=1917830 RepID=A0ABM7UNZ1_9LEPT|nr:hypothetical protein LPTSP3_g38210 [Leptospira kobayashii]